MNVKKTLFCLKGAPLLFLLIAAFAPLALRLWRFATCNAACGADSLLGLFSDTITGCAFFVLILTCPRVLRLIPLLLWALFQVGSQELFQALRRYPVWQDLHYLFDVNFLRNSTDSFRLATPIFSAIICIVSFVAAFARLPRVRLRHLVWSVTALAALFFVHTRLETSSGHAITANRNPVHNFVIDAVQNSRRNTDVAATATLPESLQHADLSGSSLLGNDKGKAKNVLVVVIEGIPGLYIPEIRQAMGVPEYHLTMSKLAEASKGAMLIPNYSVHSHQTIRGLYSILCGDFSKLSWSTPKAFELLNKPARAAACLPAQLAQHGFSTHYLQGAGLEFMAKDRVMATVGFKEVHGKEWFEEKNIDNPFPFEWGAVDSTFFKGALNYIKELRKYEHPWMLTLLTVGTHHPFGIPPELMEKYPTPQDASVAYLDDSIAKFLEELKANNVLDDTLVIITSDESHGSPHWDSVSSWGLSMVLAPEQVALPRIKAGEFGLVDIEASVLYYLGLSLPQQIIGRSYFRNYDSPREMFSFTNMVLRRHIGDTLIKCTGGHGCSNGKTTSLIAPQPESLTALPQDASEETYAIASALDNSLQSASDIQQFDFASQAIRKIEGGSENNILEGGHNLYVPENSDVTVHIKITLLDGPQAGVPFRLLAAGDRFLYSYMVEPPTLPNFPDLPSIHSGESIEESFSFHTEQKIERLTFNLQANTNSACSVRIDKLDVAVKNSAKKESIGVSTGSDSGLHPLESAAKLGDIERARELMTHGANVNTSNKLGITPLMWAAFGGHKNMVETLIDAGADINARSKRAETALSIALKSEHLDIAEFLINKGANLNDALPPISWGIHLANLKFLLKHGADINHVGGISTKWTPLMHSANRGDIDFVLFLLNHGADINAVSNKGETALYVALNNKHTDVAQILLNNGADKNAALMPAAWWGKTKAIEFLLGHGANINYKGGMGETKWTPLMHATYHGHKDAVKLLLEKGADVNIMNDKMETPLSIAIKKKYTDIAELLVANGANTDLVFKLTAIQSIIKPTKEIGKNQTLLMQAAYHGRKDLVSFLLDEGADINALSSTNKSALSIALERGHTDIVKMLLEHGANSNHLARMGDKKWTPLMHAVYHGKTDMVKLLLEKGANVNALNGIEESVLSIALKRKNADIAKILLEHGANVNYMGGVKDVKWTPLMHAVYHGKTDMVKLLLEKGANVDAMNGKMETALSIAIIKNHTDIAEILLNKGAKSDLALKAIAIQSMLKPAKIGKNQTLLMRAAYYGRVDLVPFLLNQTTDINALTDTGESALSIALNHGHTDIAETLLTKGANANEELLRASWRGQIGTVQFLLEHGADINHAGGIGVKLTPLMHATYHGHKKLVEFLLEKGADANVVADGMVTALSIALEKKREDIAKILLGKVGNPSLALMPISWTGNLDAAIFLIEHGADVNYAGGIGVVWTPLMHAAYHGHKGLAIFLLDEGASVNARDAAGNTAFKLATDRGNQPIASILKAAGGI